MRYQRIISIGVLAAAITVTTASVANAAPPEVSKKSCEAQGGTFSSDRATKTCITVWPPETWVSQHFPGIVYLLYPSVYYSGHWHVVETDQSTTTQSQKGNGDVTTTTTWQVLSHQVVGDDCLFVWEGTNGSVDTGVCEYYGVYPQS
ncbi:hypothetical protein [Dactylosporangium sp. NPDC048998]|uniref:hypothetical protein n=1 Tax=Dactylosporangium sp. NPDC048998 TaxID=3363976 RepID=UPI00371BBF85